MISWVFGILSLVLIAVLVALFVWITTPPKCPRCGARDWVHAPHVGRYWFYCRKCSLFKELAK